MEEASELRVLKGVELSSFMVDIIPSVSRWKHIFKQLTIASIAMNVQASLVGR